MGASREVTASFPFCETVTGLGGKASAPEDVLGLLKAPSRCLFAYFAGKRDEVYESLLTSAANGGSPPLWPESPEMLLFVKGEMGDRGAELVTASCLLCSASCSGV